MLSQQIKEDVLAMSEEFDNKDGYVTCEISLHMDDLDEFQNFININTNLKLGKWIGMHCKTCIDLNGEGFVHVSIERYDVIKRMEIASNFIFRQL